MGNRSGRLRVPCKFRWTAMIIPPRCRKPRETYIYKETEVFIPQIPAESADAEMPLAIIVHDELYKDSFPDTKSVHKRLYLYNGLLYEEEDRLSVDRLKSYYMASPIIVDSEAEVGAELSNIQKEYVVRDGALYRRAYEPMYEVSFGFMSGPSIMIRNVWDYDQITDNNFRADELDYAIDAALSGELNIEESCRDRLLQTKEKSCFIEVLMPEALKMPSYLNRVAQNIEKEVLKVLRKEFKFDTEELDGESGKKLVGKVMQATYMDPEVKQRRYLLYSYDIVRITKSVILGLL